MGTCKEGHMDQTFGHIGVVKHVAAKVVCVEVERSTDRSRVQRLFDMVTVTITENLFEK